MRSDGLELKVLRQLPHAFIGGLVPGAATALTANDDMTAIFAMGFAVAWTMMLLPVAVGCLIVCAMKGRQRTADSYPLPADPSDRRQ